MSTAVAHTMLVMMYHMLRDGVIPGTGPGLLDKLQPQRLTRSKRLESLGHKVTITPLDRAA